MNVTGQILPGTGRGTMHSMVEGHVPHGVTSRGSDTGPVPLHHPAGGPPPRAGEERK